MRPGPWTSKGSALGGRTMIRNRSPLNARLTTVSDLAGLAGSTAAGFGPGTDWIIAGIARVTAKHSAAAAPPRILVRYAE